MKQVMEQVENFKGNSKLRNYTLDSSVSAIAAEPNGEENIG